MNLQNGQYVRLFRTTLEHMILYDVNKPTELPDVKRRNQCKAKFSKVDGTVIEVDAQIENSGGYDAAVPFTLCPPVVTP